MPESRRNYLISEGQVRAAVALGSVGMAVIVVVLLLLATSRPQGKPQVLDGSAHLQEVQKATASITGYEDLGGGRARIDIERAMELVLERGVASPGFAGAPAAAPPAAATPAAATPAAATPAAPATTPAAPAATPPAAATPAAPPAAAETPPAAAQTPPAAPTEPAEQPPAAATTPPAAETPATAPAGAAVNAADFADGEPLFVSTCSACHQTTGQGIPMAFPPLAGHAPELYAASRDYPVEAVLFGLQGAITVHGTAYNGMMTTHLHMPDDQLAKILNYVMTAWGNDAQLPADFEPYTPDDVAAVRGKMLTMTEVYDLRKAAGLE